MIMQLKILHHLLVEWSAACVVISQCWRMFPDINLTAEIVFVQLLFQMEAVRLNSVIIQPTHGAVMQPNPEHCPDMFKMSSE